MTYRSRKIVAGILLVICLAVLGRFVLFKKPLGYYRQYFKSASMRADAIEANKANNNYVLFATIRKFYKSRRLRTEYKVDNIGGNIIGFIPLGFLFPFFMGRNLKGIKTILAVFLISLGFEWIQLKTGIGVFDVDDLFLNTTGGLIGLILYYGASWMFRPAHQPIH
ncbi:MAG: VanZ family protein [Chitinophagaceae bacterium]|nr:VanZ family protein [Chitinophagaceae bacterium]